MRKRFSFIKRNNGKLGTRLVVENVLNTERKCNYTRVEYGGPGDSNWRGSKGLQNNMPSWQKSFMVLVIHWCHYRFLLWVMRFLPRRIFHATQNTSLKNPFFSLSFLRPVEVGMKWHYVSSFKKSSKSWTFYQTFYDWIC